MTGKASATSAPRSRGGARLAPGGTGAVFGAAAPALMRGPGQSHAPVPVPPATDQGGDMTGHWPLSDFLELGALPGAVPSARLHARHILWEWGPVAPITLTDDVELVVSELVTNAVTAAQALPQPAPVRLWLLSDSRDVLVVAWDASPRPPAPADPDLLGESGRGLLLVQALSQRWGSYPTPRHGGKVVWALCGTSISQPASPGARWPGA
jgi:anti-sigma regulatory factor (Ser/Thr protein kinase)